MKNSLLIIILVIIIIAAAIWFFISSSSKPGKYDDFAQCLGEKNAVFYGAFWCSHCQNQKKEFGKSAKLLPYVECSTPDGQSQLQVCIDKQIQNYPTWEFSDGSRETGEISLSELSAKTGCVLP